jgi:UDP-glucose 4-epimerase
MNEQVVLVTGGAGYIGSHTVVALKEAGYSPWIVDNHSNSDPSALKGIESILGQPVPSVVADCGNEEALVAVFQQCKDEGHEFAGVIHFAAFKAVGESVAEPLKYYENNIGSTATLLKVMERFGVSNLVFSSSCTVYGEPDRIPVDETAPIKPAESPYGYTKQVCERMIADAVHAMPGMRATLLRYFNPIGAHPSAAIGELPIGRPNNLIPYLTQATAGLREPLTVYGDDYPTPDGTCIRDYIHVVDLAEAHVAAMDWLLNQAQGPICEPFNLGTGTGSSVKQVVETFEQVNGIAVPHDMGPRRAGDVVAIYAEANKAANVLGWRAKRDLGVALKDAWNWQQSLEPRTA